MMTRAQPIFVGGTSSHSGKSWMATAICAWLRRRGIRVAPFKAQNMSNNSYPCRGGGEIGRAQAAQAWACGLEPEPSMNPILLKPNSGGGSQVIVNGKIWQTLPARAYYEHFDFLLGQVLEAYENLAARFEVVVIEGAGSVTELNLRRWDLVNLGLVTRLSAPWLLVSDIERGGVFASVIGTVHLLTEPERSLLRAFAVNKFRGDRSLFDEGRRLLEEKTACPCLGLFPFSDDIRLDDEDSLSVPSPDNQKEQPAGSRCAIIRLPRISNTTDFRLLPQARWLDRPVDEAFDFVFLPGTKNTIEDLLWLKERGLADWIQIRHRSGATIIGVCGGLQMLGEVIADPHGMESGRGEIAGLGLLPVRTVLGTEKTTQVVNARTPQGQVFSAYEIHIGETTPCADPDFPFAVLSGDRVEGFRRERVIGTYLHGAFEDPAVLRELGIVPASTGGIDTDQRLADWFDAHAERFEELFL
jgi:adenosylcobyric acid synthase